MPPALSPAPLGPTRRERAASARRRQWLEILKRALATRRGCVALVLVSFVVLFAAIGPAVSPYLPTSLVVAPFAAPSAAHLLGGDDLGRDVLSRVLNGGWVLLVMALASTCFGIVIGATAGISAAYLRGKADGLIMRTVDVILAFPQLVFALLLVSIVGPKLWLIVLAVGFSHAPQAARVLRAASLDISERDFVKAVELDGIPKTRVMTGEILPNLITPLMVETGIRLTYSIVIMSGLSFLGFGQPPPAPNWALMMNENRIGLQTNLWGVIAPAALLALLAIGVNMFTDVVSRVAIGVERRPSDVVLIEGLVLESVQ